MKQHSIQNWYINRSGRLLCGDVHYGIYPTYVQCPILAYKEGKVVVTDSRSEDKVVMKLENVDSYFADREKEYIKYLEEIGGT